MAINGNNILVYMNGTLIAGTRSDEIQTSGEQLEIASPDTGQWREFIAGRKEWGIQVNWLLSNVSNLDRVLLVNTTVTIRVLGRGQSKGLAGTAIVQACKVTNTRGNLSQGAFSFRGSGALTKET